MSAAAATADLPPPSRSFPIAHIVDRLKAEPAAPPEQTGTGPPHAIPA